ncbi:transcription termination/antitermination protein NusA [Candidatus Pacearchaeota archaeon]|nr:transcription termination/antitermination protein NusA [Candidatus Pacearchaeota archaeon]
MNQQFMAAVNQICAEKNISFESVMEAVNAALATAYRKDFGNKEQEVEVILNDGGTFATVLLIKEVVAEVENPNVEISLAEAKKMKKDVEVGDEIRIDVTPLEYGRIAAQSAKQVILQRIQEAERESLYEMFKNRENELLSSQIMRVEGETIFINIENHTVQLSPRDQIPGEKYYNGKRIKVYLDKVVHTSRGPELSISRTHPNLVVRLLEMEIPEVIEGDVKVKSIARDAGTRSKVAVSSDDEKIDPIGACIGQKGVRIQSVMEELSGERVDIIEWSEDPREFIATALQPAKIAEVIIVNGGDDPRVRKRAAVFVEEEERPMAIGKRGQNVRLASDLTNYELDLYNLEQLPAFKEKIKELSGTDRRMDDADLGGEAPETEASIEAAEASIEKEEGGEPGHWGGLTKAIVNKLEKAGYKTLEDLNGMDLKALEGIEGIGKASAAKIEKEIS